MVLTPGGGHAERLLPIVQGLSRRGFDVHVMTRADVGEFVKAAGGIFSDLYKKYPVDAADRESVPFPIRLVSFAATYLEPLTVEIAALRPLLIIYDSFMVVAPLVARRLGIPHIGVRAGHAQEPSRAIDAMRADPRVRISAACEAAVAKLRASDGFSDASPFSYLDGVSPYLNLYPEPPAFLDDESRLAFQPLAFFGSLAPDLRESRSHDRPLARGAGKTRIYVSFGGVIWKYYADIALAALGVLADVFARCDADVLVSLGNHHILDAERRRLERTNVRVITWIDQWGALIDADLFVTHNGLNSTHEAVFHQVPMLSYAFLSDQAAMAQTCQRLGLAIPLTDRPRASLDAQAVRRHLENIALKRPDLDARLAEARTWELETIAGRDAVLDRMLALAGV